MKPISNNKLILLFCGVLLFGLSSIAQTNLISNGNLEMGNFCSDLIPDCSGGAEFDHLCVTDWRPDHGTPHITVVTCNDDPKATTNRFISCIGRSGYGNLSQGEGFFQQVDLVPGQTYELCLWIYSILPNGTTWISLGNSSPGIGNEDNCLHYPNPGHMPIFQRLASLLATEWHRVEIVFTVPLESDFDRIIFWQESKKTSKTNFDNISLHHRCGESWTISQPGYQIDARTHAYSDFISIESNNPNGQYISNNVFGSTNLNAGNQIRIKPGAEFKTTGAESVIFSIEDCQINDGFNICYPPPCGGGGDAFSGSSGEEGGEGGEGFDYNMDSKSLTVNVFPNPNSDNYIHIYSNVELEYINVYDVFGQVVLSYNDDEKYLNISSLRTGQYILEAVDIYGNKSFNRLIRP